MKCPNCGLTNPPTAERCDCGFSFTGDKRPIELTQEDRTWGMLVHLATFIGLVLPFGSFIGPLIVWQVRGKDSAFIDSHGRESVNFQLTLLVAVLVMLGVAGGIVYGMGLANIGPETMTVLLIGGGLIGATIGVANIVLPIVAAIRANAGRGFRYPCTLSFVGRRRWPPQ